MAYCTQVFKTFKYSDTYKVFTNDKILELLKFRAFADKL